MKLFAKFTILAALIGISVIVSLGFAGWTVMTIQREVTESYTTITVVFQNLDRTKIGYEFFLLRVNEGAYDLTDADDQRTVRQTLDSVKRSRDQLAQTAGLRQMVGTTTADTLLARFDRTAELLDRWYDQFTTGADEAQTQTTFEQAAMAFERFHELTEISEQRILSDAMITITHAQEMRFRLNLILIGCLGVALLTGILALLLFRRWVLQPIRALRIATSEIAEGNFDYRIAVQTRDEFGTLSNEVNSMSATIVDMQSRLLERERLAAIGEMVRRLVHNLRNPLAGIRSLAEFTRAELSSESDLRENQDRIVTAVDRFEGWLNDLLQSTSPLQLQLEATAPTDLLQQVIESHIPVARGKKIDLQLDATQIPIEVPIDRVHLEQAIVALVSNALEMTPGGGKVLIDGTAATPQDSQDRPDEKSDDVWQLCIQDSGPGVPPEDRDRIFAPYFTTRKTGTGIGLAIVRNVIHAHGGRVRVEDSELGGAAFILTLPR